MLGLIMDSRLTPPTNDKQTRDAVNLVIHKGCKGVNYVAQTAVLHVDNRYLSGCQMITGGKGGGTTLVGSNDMFVTYSLFVHEIVPERTEKGVGNTCKKIEFL